MGSIMADLKGLHAAINANLAKRGEHTLSEDELLALYGQADVVVLPTRGEGLNLPAADSHKSFRARRVRNQKQQARVRSVSASHDAIAEPEGRS